MVEAGVVSMVGGSFVVVVVEYSLEGSVAAVVEGTAGKH